jgi:predicted regulator of Ras-like GTPase activity (Roadblock/LC7/MglB family)
MSPAGAATGHGDQALRASLTALKDVAGVTGSFVCGFDGRLIARELPAVFDDAALHEAGGRLTRIRETFAAVGDAVDVVVIRMGDHKLYLKSLSGGLLCIVAETKVNMPALRMASNLVSRRIAGAIELVDATPVPEPAPTPRLTADPTARGLRTATLVAGTTGRRFRGRVIE